VFFILKLVKSVLGLERRASDLFLLPIRKGNSELLPLLYKLIDVYRPLLTDLLSKRLNFSFLEESVLLAIITGPIRAMRFFFSLPPATKLLFFLC
jgi:hypothetical protein